MNDYKQLLQISEHDRRENAKRFGISLVEIDRLLISANKAYEIIKNEGPFYGREDISEPTFRITAEPVVLPEGSEELLVNLGKDLFYLGKALKKLPEDIKKYLGRDLDYNIPITWRVDAIIDKQNRLRVNEIEGQDGASALMIAEQLAYSLQSLSESTAARLVKTFHILYGAQNNSIKIAWLRVNNPHNANATQFIKYVDEVSKGSVKMEHIFEDDLHDKKTQPIWNTYQGVISETSMPPKELYNLGIKKGQLLVAGNYSALVNKGAFALLFDALLNNFWNETLGKDRLQRLRNILIPTKFIHNTETIEKARKSGKVVKVSWAGNNTSIINRSRGVAIPDESIEQGNNERWNLLREMVQQDYRIIAQDFVEPKKIFAYLRKKGTNLEPIEWYNRVCVKYVVMGNPEDNQTPEVALTATEVTLGPDIVPAGRKCTFTAGVLN